MVKYKKNKEINAKNPLLGYNAWWYGVVKFAVKVFFSNIHL